MESASNSNLTAGRPGSKDPAAQSPQQWLSRLSPEVVVSLPYPFAKRHNLLAICREGRRVHILGTARPTLEMLTELRRHLGGQPELHRIEQSVFDSLLRQAYDKGQSEATQMVDDMGEEVDIGLLASELPEATDLLEAADTAPVVRLINALLTQAIREDASDIHLEVFEKRSLVRFRVDGVLRDIVEPQRGLHGALVSRLKVMANLDIAEKRLPQDGRISLNVGDRPIDVRVSTLPTQYGERVVLRLLDKQGGRLNLADLGMRRDMQDRFDQLIRAPHGIILVTGPTGSGKTTTLYAGLSELDRKRLNILTIEDPVEYDLDGVGQIQVRPKIGLTFASGLRSILRQDPDVVLVGEIRDLETAEIAVQASLTGHLVLSTLHTNTAVGAITRLEDMGVERFLIASSLIGVLSQRLVRKLCLECRVEVSPDEAERALIGDGHREDVRIYRASGCEKCEFTGYRGRTGIYELITIDETLRTLIHERKSEDQMLAHIRRSMPSLQRNGVEKALAGITSLDEVVRVTRDQ
ncbi:MAG: type II secretion system ATPase GspE [Pseudomonadota bacterium]|nr:type II secretion system ATPase GspE [Pseudomonadota bacterium]